MNNASLREALINAAREMNESGINQGTSGNLSARCEGGMLVTPSALAYADLEPEDIVFVSEQGDASGRRTPSSEWRIHWDIYRNRADAHAILHAHPAHCTTLACLEKPIPAFHYMVAVAGGPDIRCAAYATFGTQSLSDNVLAALEGRNACLMAQHGMVCLAADPGKTLSLAIEIEHLARVYRQCLQLGEPELLEESEMQRVLEKFAVYKSISIS